MIYAIKHRLRPGDRLISPLFATGLTKHHAIYLGMDTTGIEWVAENHKLLGVRAVKATAYFASAPSFIIRPFSGSYAEMIVAVQRALAEVGKPYDLINYNCEHYAEYVQNGLVFSQQVENVKALACIALGTIAVFAALTLFKNNKL